MVNLKFEKSYQKSNKSNNKQGSKNKLETFMKNIEIKLKEWKYRTEKWWKQELRSIT